MDNNSAINVNSAWSRLYDFNGNYNANTGTLTLPNPIAGTFDDPGSTPGLGGVLGFYRTNVGLLELLRTYSPANGFSKEMDLLNAYRFGGNANPPVTSASLTRARYGAGRQQRRRLLPTRIRTQINRMPWKMD